uniref:Uncharacterized protein n=1 Tax=Ciona intestinalis TaxID=7719 RepID=H2Y2N0_CIOIN
MMMQCDEILGNGKIQIIFCSAKSLSCFNI